LLQINKNRKAKILPAASTLVLPTQTNTGRVRPRIQQEPTQPRLPQQPNSKTQERQSDPNLDPTPKTAQWKEMSTQAKQRWRQAQKHLYK
jgi:hypothetical protein